MKIKESLKSQKGITLVALIITIIVLVILVAVSIVAIYNSKIVSHAVNGVTGYSNEALNENRIMERTENLIESTVVAVKDILREKGKLDIPEEKPKNEEGKKIDEINVGDYIAYTPEGNTASTVIERDIDGLQLGETVQYKRMEKWSVLKKSGNTITIVGDGVGNRVTLCGANGYQNAVYILNKTCNDLYQNTALGLKARNINQDDVDEALGYTPSYDKTKITPSNTHCPSIYTSEVGCTGGESIKRSFQDSTNDYWSQKTYTGTAYFTRGGYTTRKNYAISSYGTENAQKIVSCESKDKTSNLEYWVASRCTGVWESVTCFYMFFVVRGEVSDLVLYSSQDFSYDGYSRLRPVVDINLDFYNIGKTGTGEADYGYSISKK